MCGLFGYYGKGFDASILSGAFHRARKRGPDGTAWWDGKSLRSDKLQGSLVLGHCRLATSGAVATVQPLAADRHAITHNGNIRGHQQLAERIGLRLQTTVDSELILRFIERTDDLEAMLEAVPLEPGAVVAATPRAIHFYAKRLPLYLLTRDDGIYWCSTKGPEPDWRAVDRYTISRDV